MHRMSVTTPKELKTSMLRNFSTYIRYFLQTIAQKKQKKFFFLLSIATAAFFMTSPVACKLDHTHIPNPATSCKKGRNCKHPSRGHARSLLSIGHTKKRRNL